MSSKIITDDKIRKDIKYILSILKDLDKDVKNMKNDVDSLKLSSKINSIDKNYDNMELETKIYSALSSKLDEKINAEMTKTLNEKPKKNKTIDKTCNTMCDENEIETDLDDNIKAYISAQIDKKWCEIMLLINERFEEFDKKINDIRRAFVRRSLIEYNRPTNGAQRVNR